MEANLERSLLALAAARLHEHLDRPVHHPVDASAYVACEAITKYHSKTFHLASSLLPPHKRHAVHALYAFCRTVDDSVDASLPHEQGKDLEHWRQIVRTLEPPARSPIASAWVETIRHFKIPNTYALQLIDGVARDMATPQYRTFDELAHYCYGVASTVGLMSMHIIGFHSDEAIPYAIKLGVALQLTNILRDVGEDIRNGRVYLPEDDLSQFGLTRADLAAHNLDDRWVRFMQYQISRARELYKESHPGLKLLSRDGRFAIAAASGLYEGILGVIERNGYDVFTRRASLSGAQKLRRLPALALSTFLS